MSTDWMKYSGGKKPQEVKYDYGFSFSLNVILSSVILSSYYNRQFLKWEAGRGVNIWTCYVEFRVQFTLKPWDYISCRLFYSDVLYPWHSSSEVQLQA